MNRRKLLPSFLYAIFWSILLGACTSVEVKQKETGIPFVGDFNVSKFTLKNGLKLLVLEDDRSPTFAYQTWYDVGSRDEEVGKTGLAHLFEHMMFKRTKNMKEGEFNKILEKAGVVGENAFTSNDYTTYVQELPVDKLELIAKLESDRMTNLVVDDEAFKTELEVVQNERRFRNENSPDGTMYQELFDLGFKRHSYHWPVIGYQKDLEGMSSKDAREFYKLHYAPNRATIVIVGDISPSDALNTIEKYYGKLEPQVEKERDLPKEPPISSTRRKVLHLNTQVEKIYIGYHVPGVTHEDAPAFELIQSILSDGKSSRLSRSLVETGIASSVGSGSFQMADPSLFLINIDLQKNKKASIAESVVKREIDRLKVNPVSPVELKRAKNLLKFHFMTGLDSNSAKAQFLGRYETVSGSFQKGLSLYQKVDELTPRDISRIVKKYFNHNKRVVITGVPK